MTILIGLPAALWFWGWVVYPPSRQNSVHVATLGMFLLGVASVAIFALVEMPLWQRLF
jgi:hypothetical protein